MGNFVLLPEQRISLEDTERENHWGWGISFCFRNRISLEKRERTTGNFGVDEMGNLVLQDQPRRTIGDGEFRFASGAGSAWNHWGLFCFRSKRERTMGMGNFVNTSFCFLSLEEREPLWKISFRFRSRINLEQRAPLDQQTLIFLSFSVENERC